MFTLSLKNIRSILLTLLILSFVGYQPIVLADSINVTVSVGIIEATNFAVAPPGPGRCDLSWNASLTPNVDNQELSTYLWTGGTWTFVSTDNIVTSPFVPGALETTTMYGLTPGSLYTFGHVSQAGRLSSTGIMSASCIPTASTIPAPILATEPAETPGTTNTLSFQNSGMAGFSDEYNISVSIHNLAANPSAAILYESGWNDNTWGEWTIDATDPMNLIFEYTFGLPPNDLTAGTTYYYHVQKRVQTWPWGPMNPMVLEYSPYSNVEFSAQASSGGGGGGGGGTPPPPPPVCGNGSNEAGEECDDGNTISGDGCSASCVLEVLTAVCGNNAIEAPETCDDGNTTDGDGCDATCQIEIPADCGDGNLDAGEECDDGNNLDGDGCSMICTSEIPPACGDNTLDVGEECDDGNTANDDGCSALCFLEDPQVCGNGLEEPGEECDDGNTTSGDGCSAICEDELVEVTFHIKAKPEYRMIIDSTPNLDMSSIFGLEDNATGNMLVHNTVAIDDFGLATYTTEIPTGNYDAGINGEAHLTKIIRSLQITESTTDVTLDFTFGDTVDLLAGDIKDDNFVNALDIAIMLEDYQKLGDNVADLNNEDYINALDMAVLLKNYFVLGENY
jgi:cysteine-rich repeat protein